MVREIQTRVFATLPEIYRKPRRSSEWCRFERPGAQVHSFLEGPSFDREGRLYCVDIAYGRIFRISPQGEWDLVTEYDGEPTGLKIHADGRIFIADNKHGVMQLDPQTGAVTPFVTRVDFEPLQGSNDLVFARDGTLYLTVPGQSCLARPTGRLYRIAPDGTGTLLLDNIPYPNGLVLNRAETSLYLAVTYGNAIWSVPLGGPTPRPNGVGVFVHLSGGLGPDGLALDTAGNLAVAQARQGMVWLFSELGDPILRAVSCAGRSVTNVAFGGSDRRNLYITEAATGSVLIAEMPAPGVAMFSGA
jgi:gluconolactonase